MKERIYKIIESYYQKHSIGIAQSWIITELIENGETQINEAEIDEALKQLQRESKITCQVGGFYIPS